ncbi:major facilitator superfamily protein [Wolffia australiana]
MGLSETRENGDGGGVHGSGLKKLLPLPSRKGRYMRMDEDLAQEGDGNELGRTDFGDRKASAKKFVLACAVFASLNSLLLGYDVGVMSGAILFIEEDLRITEVQQEILVGCLSVVSLLGSLAGGKTSDIVGRKWTIGLAAIVFQCGGLIMAFAPSFLFLMIGRLMAGIGIGFGVMIAPVYIAEISPALARGTLTSIPEIFINIGILLGYISNYVFSELPAHLSWRVMLGMGILPSVFVAVALFFVPESPRWLVMENRLEEARFVLSRICESEEEISQRLAEIEEAAGTHSEKAVWREFLRPSPALRRMLIAGIGIQCFQQVTGIDATVYYSPAIFKDAGIRGNKSLLAATVAVGFAKTLFILVAILLIDKVGRKPLLYASTVGMTCCLFVLGVALHLLRHGVGSREVGISVAVAAVCANVGFFSVGIGPICWVLSAEIFPLRLRAQAVGLGAAGNRICSGLVAMSFLSLTRVISTAGAFFLFSGVSAVSVLFVYACVPETKGKTLEQIELMFQRGDEGKPTEVQLGDVERLVQKE